MQYKVNGVLHSKITLDSEEASYMVYENTIPQSVRNKLLELLELDTSKIIEIPEGVALYKFYLDCGRMGDVEGAFVFNTELLKSFDGLHVYFGEILGKHSEIYFNLSLEEHCSLESEDPETIAEFIKANGQSTGYSPLDYFTELSAWEWARSWHSTNQIKYIDSPLINRQFEWVKFDVWEGYGSYSCPAIDGKFYFTNYDISVPSDVHKDMEVSDITTIMNMADW